MPEKAKSVKLGTTAAAPHLSSIHESLKKPKVCYMGSLRLFS